MRARGKGTKYVLKCDLESVNQRNRVGRLTIKVGRLMVKDLG